MDGRLEARFREALQGCTAGELQDLQAFLAWLGTPGGGPLPPEGLAVLLEEVGPLRFRPGELAALVERVRGERDGSRGLLDTGRVPMDRRRANRDPRET